MAIPTVWSDIHSSVTTDAKGSIRKAINVDAVITSIDNILRTRPGERIFRPEFGAGIQSLLFYPTLQELYDSIANRIRDAIEVWDDRVIINSINFQAKPDSNLLTIQMIFSVRGYDKVFEYNTNLKGMS